MDELKTYLTLSKQVNQDAALLEMIHSYEDSGKKLALLLQNKDYDAAEAIRLTNDIEYLSEQIFNSPLYRSYVEAKDALRSVLAKRSEQFIPSCACGCNKCEGGCCSHPESEETNL